MFRTVFRPAEEDGFVDRGLELWWVELSLRVMLFGIEVLLTVYQLMITYRISYIACCC